MSVDGGGQISQPSGSDPGTYFFKSKILAFNFLIALKGETPIIISTTKKH
jgi:hypothetical protein